MVAAFSHFRAGGWGKPGVAGAASEHPLEGVENNEVRTRGRLSPIYTKKTAAFYCYGL